MEQSKRSLLLNEWVNKYSLFFLSLSLTRHATPFLSEYRPYWREHFISRLQGAAAGWATLSCPCPPFCVSPAPTKVGVSFVSLQLSQIKLWCSDPVSTKPKMSPRESCCKYLVGLIKNLITEFRPTLTELVLNQVFVVHLSHFVFCLVGQPDLLLMGRREAARSQSRLRWSCGDTGRLWRERTLYLWRKVWYLTELQKRSRGLSVVILQVQMSSKDEQEIVF